MCCLIAHAAHPNGGTRSTRIMLVPFAPLLPPLLLFFCPVRPRPSPIRALSPLLVRRSRSVGEFFSLLTDPRAARRATKIASRLVGWILSVRLREERARGESERDYAPHAILWEILHQGVQSRWNLITRCTIISTIPSWGRKRPWR